MDAPSVHMLSRESGAAGRLFDLWLAAVTPGCGTAGILISNLYSYVPAERKSGEYGDALSNSDCCDVKQLKHDIAVLTGETMEPGYTRTTTDLRSESARSSEY